MNNLLVKEVEFQGANLKACQNDENKKIYVGVSWVCNGLGLTKSQKDTQVQKVQNDLVLKMGCLKFQAGVFDNDNEVVALDIEYLPLWLAKITITPKMQNEQVELVDKLVEYQLKAKDVLANAFIHNLPQMGYEDLLIQHLMQMKEVRLKQEQQDSEIKLLQDKQSKQDNKVATILDYATHVPDFKTIQNAINKYARLRGKSQFEVRGEVYKKVNDVYGIDLTKRVNNVHKKLQDERASNGKNQYTSGTLNQKYNKMDVIKEEKLEKEVIQILMDMTAELNK